jgi:hypothetical protein
MGDGWQPTPAGEEKAIRAAWVAHLQPAGELEFPSADSRRRNSRSAVSPDPGGKYGDAASSTVRLVPVSAPADGA